MVFLPVVAIAVISGLSCGKPSTSTPTKVQRTLHLETFVLNLAGEDERAYLRVGIDLGLRDPAKKEKEGDAAFPVALVRDTILGVLSAARPDDILTLAGKQTLKANILKALRERVPELAVQEVYFTEFLIQR